MRRLAGLALAMSVLGGGCASAPPAAPRSGASTASEYGATTVGSGPLDAVRVREIGRAVAGLRRLAYRRDVPVSFVDARTFEARAVENMASHATDSVVALFSDESPTESYRAKARYLLAVYSPSRQAVFVRKILPEGWTTQDLEALLAHELVHALQYQHFDPDKQFEARRKDLDLDATAALNAFLEGEAELVSIGFAAQRRGGPARRAMVEVGRDRTLDAHVFAVAGNVNGALAKASSAVQANELFPYQFGPFFAAALHRTGGTDLLDRAWASPPATTREIFEPRLYLQSAQKYQLPPLPLPAGHEALLSVTLGSVGFYRLASTQAANLAKVPGAAVPTQAALLELASHVVADRFTFTKGLFGRRPLLVCWVFDGPEHAQQVKQLFQSPMVWAIGDRVVFFEGVPNKLLAGLPERIASLPLTRVTLPGRPPATALAALPETGSTLLRAAQNAPSPAAASRAVVGGLRLEQREGDQVLGPGESWIAGRRRDGVTTFVSLLGDGIHDSDELVAAFKKGAALDKANASRRALPPVEYAKYTFMGERIEWTGGSVLVLNTPACDGVARLLITMVPAPPEDAVSLEDVRGLAGLRTSPFCAKVRDQRSHDLP